VDLVLTTSSLLNFLRPDGRQISYTVCHRAADVQLFTSSVTDRH